MKATSNLLSNLFLYGLLLMPSLEEGQAFTIETTSIRPNLSKPPVSMLGSTPIGPRSILGQHVANFRLSTSRLSMYNLPPGGGGGGKNEVVDILKGVGGVALFLAFFASPLGSIFFGLLNSFLFLSFLVPLLGVVGFQAWQYFNTISGVCPNCNAPATVMKSNDGESVPNVCFNCGAILQANYDNTGIDNVTGRNSVDNMSEPTSIFDIFGPGTTTTTTTTIGDESSPEARGKRTKTRNENTIIDVEIEDDKPFQ